MIALSIVACVLAMLVIRGLHLSFAAFQRCLDLLVDLLQLLGIGGGCRNDIFGSRIESAVGMAALRRDKRSVAVRGVDCVVVRELCDLKILDPIGLMVVDIKAQIRLELLVITLREAVRLRVIRCAQGSVYA